MYFNDNEWIRLNTPSYSVAIPSSWIISSTSIFEMFIYAETATKVMPNLGISRQRIKSGVSLWSISEGVRQKQSAEYAGYEVTKFGEITVGSEQGLIHYFRWHDREVDIRVAQFQQLAIHDDTLFSITASCEQRTDNSALPYLEKIANSLNFRL